MTPDLSRQATAFGLQFRVVAESEAETGSRHKERSNSNCDTLAIPNMSIDAECEDLGGGKIHWEPSFGRFLRANLG